MQETKSKAQKKKEKEKAEREKKFKEEADRKAQQSQGKKSLTEHVTEQLAVMASQMQKLQAFSKGQGKWGKTEGSRL